MKAFKPVTNDLNFNHYIYVHDSSPNGTESKKKAMVGSYYYTKIKVQKSVSSDYLKAPNRHSRYLHPLTFRLPCAKTKLS